MKNFLTDNFILTNETAKILYRNYAADLPIIDYHCHINPKEIYEDKEYDNITQMWLYGDHYKWRIMRACGVDEKYVTGDASDYEKFVKYAESLEKAIGNPLYHWSHMELKKYFGYEGVLNSRTADCVWNMVNAVIKEKKLSVRKIIDMSHVEVICTTDDPIDNLAYHQKIYDDSSVVQKVLPAWRPDKLINLEKPEFPAYINELSKAAGVEINSMQSLKAAAKKRMEYFAERGCKVSDHGLDYVPYENFTEEEVEAILQKALKGEEVSFKEVEQYKTAMMIFFAQEYRKAGWVMQLHYGCERNINTQMFNQLGPDTGYDCISDYAPSGKITAFLDKVNSLQGLPKTIIYSLNPTDNAVIDTIIGAYMDSDAGGKLQHGSAWWFNDHKQGMEEQLISLASRGVLGQFVGMLTDSRSFLSYTRHDYFRRILCSLIGEWVEKGEYPNDEESLGLIVRGICHDNAATYFNF